MKMKPKVLHCGHHTYRNKTLRRLSNRENSKLKLRSYREHIQIVTNRKRSLNVELIDDSIAVLTIETAIIYTTIGHHFFGKLKSRNMTNNHCRNLGLVSRYFHTDLVKLIYVKDIPKIISDFESGKSLNQIKYSSWPLLQMTSNNHDLPTKTSTVAIYNRLELCDRLINRLFAVPSSLYMSLYRTTTFTSHMIKSISDLIGF